MRAIHYSLFSSHLIYACEIWRQNQTNQLFKKLLLLQENALKIINFQPQTSFSNDLFKESRILQISDFVNYRYAVFVRNSLTKNNLQIFNGMFTPLGLNHIHNTRAAANHFLDVPQKQTTHYGMTFKETPMKTSWNAKLVNSKRSHSKHNLLNTATATKQLQHYLIKTLFTTNSISFFSFFHFFLSSFYLFLFCYHHHSFIVFLLSLLLAKILTIGIISYALLLDGS